MTRVAIAIRILLLPSLLIGINAPGFAQEHHHHWR